MNKTEEYILFSGLEDIYGVMRRVQASHNTSELTAQTRCIGAGNCCRIGLVIPVFECFNIAKNIRSDYWFQAETFGQTYADLWYEDLILRLKETFTDPDWSIENEQATKRKCVFFRDKGCSIYRYRPLICRAYGTITPVDHSCPRGRNENGDVVIFRGGEIDTVIDRFELLLKKYAEVEPNNDLAVFMPLGVLRFLLPEDEFRTFMVTIDGRFIQAHSGYPHQMKKKEGVEVEIR